MKSTIYFITEYQPDFSVSFMKNKRTGQLKAKLFLYILYLYFNVWENLFFIKFLLH